MTNISKRPDKRVKKPAKATATPLHVWGTVKDGQVTGAFNTRNEARDSGLGTVKKFVQQF